MKRVVFTVILSTCGLIICFASINPITGKWTTIMRTEDGSKLKTVYTFKVNGHNFTGKMAFSGQSFPISNGIIRGDSISFFVSIHENSIKNKGKLYPDSIGLDGDDDGHKYHNTLVRVHK